jgi:hypothetical protein
MGSREVLTADLTRTIESGTTPVLVLVTFDTPPSVRVLLEFGLEELPGNRATRALQAPAILNLAERPEVRGIATLPVDSANIVPADPKFNASLSRVLNRGGDGAYEVYVMFSGPVSEETLRSLDLQSPTPDSSIIVGRLSSRAIRALAKRDDVVYIEHQQPPQPAAP